MPVAHRVDLRLFDHRQQVMKLQHQPTTRCEPAGMGSKRAPEVGLMSNAVYVCHQICDLVRCADDHSGRSEASQP